MNTAFKHVLVLTSLWTALAPGFAYALPDAKLSLPIELEQRRQSDPLLKTAPVYLDHDLKNRVYVGPAARKMQAGGFHFTNYVGDCSRLQQVFELTYAVPKGSPEELRTLALQGPVSPYFDFHYGNSVRLGTKLKMIEDKMSESSRIRDENTALMAEYEEASARLSKATEIRSRIGLSIEAMERRSAEAYDEVRAAKTPEERDVAREHWQAVRTEVAEAKSEALRQLRAAESDEYKASLAFGAAKGKADQILNQISVLTDQAKAIRTIYEMIDESSKNAFNAAVTTLAKVSSEPIGRASAAFQLWSDEQSKLAELLAKSVEGELYRPNARTDYSVVPLQVTNVRIQQAKVANNTERIDTSVPNSQIPAQVVYDSGAVANSTVDSQSTVNDKPVFKDEKTGKPLPILTQTPSNTAETFAILVSRGAYCMTNPQGEPQTSLGASFDGSAIQRFAGRQYTARKQQKIIHQPVALNYQYYLHADPVAVSCTLEISKFNSYSRSSGSKGALFWRRSWDDTTRNLVSNNGVHCDIQDNPNYLNEEQKVKWKNDLLQRMSQELMAEYVLQFADKWTFIGEKSANVPTVQSGPLIGSSHASLCRNNDYCQIIDIVWKSANQIFGGAQGSTSTSDSLSGVIRRSYRESGYRLQDASTAIDVEVALE